MSTSNKKPHLLLDVDGVLNVLAGIPDEDVESRGYQRAYMEAERLPGGNGNRVRYHGWRTPEQREDNSRVWSDFRDGSLEVMPPTQIFVITWRDDLPAMMEKLSEKFSLTWATTWEESANTYLSPLFGLLDDLPFISFEDMRPGLYQSIYAKTPHIVEWAAGEPFLWLDDQVGRSDQEAIEGLWDRLNPGVPCQQVAQRIPRDVGITWDTVDLALEWAERI